MAREVTRGPEGNPLVSVIVPFLNGGKFIREALESVFSQTYRNWELILVDDGSTDSSTEIARQYAELHPGKVRYLEHEGHRNRGQGASRNLGMRGAAGELFAFLDCDDVWLPQKLEQQVAILNLHPQAGMVFGASQYWRSWTGQEEALTADSIPDLGVPENTLFGAPELLVILHPLGEGTAPCPSDLLVRRTAAEKARGFPEEFRSSHSVYEDQVFLCRVYLSETVFVSGECWTRYRVHPDSCMSTVEATGQFPAARLFFLNYLDRYLAAEGVQDVRIWSLLRKALRPYGRSISRGGVPEVGVRELKWQLRVARGNHAQLVFPPEDPELLRVAISEATTRDPWDIQLNQPNLVVKSGCSYKLTFRARADRSRTINLGFSKAHNPWDGLGLYRTIDVTPEWQDHDFEFVANADDENARIHFDVGGNGSSVELSSLILATSPEGMILEPDAIIRGIYPISRWAEIPYPDEREAPAPGDSCPRFSVVIPTYQRMKLVLDAVRSFARQDCDSGFEVIVVVDGSRDGSTEALRSLQLPFPLVVIEQPNQGLAAARNRGASAARGDILLFLDDDMEAHPRLLAEHQHHHSQGADAVLGHIPLHPKAPITFLTDAVKWWVSERGNRLSQPGADPGLHDLMFGQASVKREVFQKVGGFDPILTKEGTYGNEDIDFGHRLLVGGYKVVFNPYALSYQNYVVQPRHFLRQIRERGRADVAFARKHPDLAGELFSPRPGRSVRPELWRVLAALSPLSVPLMAALRSLAIALIRRESEKSIRFFYEIYEMEYWRGVHEGGGMPETAVVRVLCYHAIRDLAGAAVMEPYGTPDKQFRWQMRTLQRLGFRFISGEKFLAFLNRAETLPPLPVLLTFDDCYDDLLQFGLPVLKQLAIPAIAFAVSSLLGQSNSWIQADGATELRLLDRKGLHLLAENGVEIGAHSRTHRMLTQVPPEELQDEASGSLHELEASGFVKPRMFAYPYGEWNPVVRRALKDAGFEAAFTVDTGSVRLGCDRYLIPRIQVLREDVGWRFLWKVIRAT